MEVTGAVHDAIALRISGAVTKAAGKCYIVRTLLANFTPDFINLDMALVRGVEASRSREAIARATVRVCQGLGVQVIAERVENAAERYFFLHEGVTLMQGYLFARPVFQALTSTATVSWPAPPHR